MLEIREYSKEAIAAKLGISAAKACNVTRKLRNLGYKFTTAGRGSTYRIYITQLPEMNLSNFAREYLGIRYYESTAAAFKEYLLMDKTGMSALAIAEKLGVTDDTIARWNRACEAFAKIGY